MQGRLYCTTIFLSLIAAAATSGLATERLSGNVSSLVSSIQQLAEQPPGGEQALAAARQRLSSSVEKLEQLLARTNSDAAARWSNWLELTKLHEQLATDKPDVATLTAIEERLYRNYSGLELPAFLALRRDLGTFRTAYEYATAKSPPELYRDRLTDLAQSVERLVREPAYAEGYQAGQTIGWLQSLDEHGAAVADDIRNQFCQSNAFALASARLANLLFKRNVAERNYIAEMVLGSYMRGVAITEAQLALGMAPSDDHGTLEILLRGHVSCPSNVADRRRISVYSSTYTTIDAKKQVFVSDQGLRMARAAAQCATSVDIQEVDAPRLLERATWRRAGRLTPEAETMTSRRAESQAASSLDQQADASLSKINNTFCQQVRAPLIRFNALPEEIRVWTDPTHIHMSLCQHNEFQLAVTGPAPTLPSNYDIGGCVHESMINNLAEPTLGGKSLDDATWLEIMHLILGAPPRALWVHDRAERWSVTFAKQLPVVTRFDRDRVGITLHLAGVTRGGQFIQKPVEIHADFVPKITDDGPVLLRDGKLSIRVGGGEAGGDQDDLRDFLSRKFGAIFPPEIDFTGFMPPAGGSLGKLRLLKLVEFGTAAGWITLAYELKGQINPATLPIAQSALRPTGAQ